MKIGYFGLIIRHKKILLVSSAKDNGLWAMPGGGRKKGEKQIRACQREIKEETNLDAKIGKCVGTFLRTDMQAKMVVFAIPKISGQLQPDGVEILDCKWFSMEELWQQREKIKSYHFAAIYKILVQKKKRQKNLRPLQAKLNGLPNRKQWRKIL